MGKNSSDDFDLFDDGMMDLNNGQGEEEADGEEYEEEYSDDESGYDGGSEDLSSEDEYEPYEPEPEPAPEPPKKVVKKVKKAPPQQQQGAPQPKGKPPKQKKEKPPKQEKSPKQKKEKPPKQPGEKKPINKFAIIGIAAVAAIIIGAIVIVPKIIKPSGESYPDLLQACFTNELGTFRYVFSVETGEEGTIITPNTPPPAAQQEELNNMEAASDETAPAAQTVETEHEFVDWNKYSEVKGGYWNYPVYQIVVEGCTTSLEPLVTKFDIYLATSFNNTQFTSVTCYQDNYYIDIELMRQWLLNSRDDYLISLGNGLIQGSKYLVIPAAEFSVASRYAEAGEVSVDNRAYVTGMTTMYRRFLVNLQTFVGQIASVLPENCLSSTKDVSQLSVSGQDSVTVLNAVKNVVTRVGDFNRSKLETAKSRGLYDDAQYNQALAEQDNIIAAWSNVNTIFNTEDLASWNLMMSGTARQITNGHNNQQIEANFAAQLTVKGVDYKFQIEAVRSGDVSDVTLPQGSQLTTADLATPTQVTDTLNSVCDYLNFTGIEPEKQLELTPENIKNNTVDEFIELVNEVGCYNQKLSNWNFQTFLETYINYEQTSETTEADLQCAQLVKDFVESLNGLTGGLVVETEKVVEEQIEQYPDLNFNTAGIDFSLKYDEELSDANLVVLDGEAINKTDTNLQVDLTLISLRSLLGSIYPANNYTILHDNDNSITEESIPTALEFTPGLWKEFKLYFVVSEDKGHMDLFVGDDQVGAVVEY